MSTLEDEKTINDPELEIIDLDPPDRSPGLLGIRVLHGQRLSLQARWSLILLTILGSMAFLFLQLANMPHAKDTRPLRGQAIAMSTFEPRFSTILDGVLYIPSADASVHALRASDGRVLWQHKGLVDAYPAATTNGIVFLLEQSNATLDALRISDGSLLWSHQKGGWPIVDSGLVYVDEQDKVEALRPADGTVVWQQKLNQQPIWASNGVIYTAAPDGGGVGAFRGSDGTLLWRQKIDGTIIAVDHDTLYLRFSDQSIATLRGSDGSLLWHENALKTDGYPLLVNGTLYFTPSDGAGEIVALRGSDGALLWSRHISLDNPQFIDIADREGQIVSLVSRNGDTDFLRASDGSLLWHYTNPDTSGQPGFSWPGDHGIVYLRSKDGGIDVYHASDGTLLWHRPSQDHVLLVEQGIIFFYSNTSRISAMRASDGTLLWHSLLSISGLTIN